MQRCATADTYDCMLPPRCDANRGCVSCVTRWQAAQAERIRKAAIIREQQRAVKKAAKAAGRGADPSLDNCPF